jgi:uncharacterized protein YjbI with pentapeptide repeats
VRFEGARLERASFAGATLVGVAFTGAGLEHVSFRAVRMDNDVSLHGALIRVSFAGACLSGATFNGSDARPARFALAEGVDVRFDRTRLTAASLEGAKLADSALGGARIAALPEGWTKSGAPLTADERRTLCAGGPGNP